MKVVLEFICPADGAEAWLKFKDQTEKLAAVAGIYATTGRHGGLLQTGAGVHNEDGTSLVIKETTHAS